MTSLRTKGKSTIVWVLLGLLLLGLGGFGVTSFSTSSTDIGHVGDTKISGTDYARTLNGELQAMAQQSGQRMTVEQARAMGIPQQVQSRLVVASALEEEARRAGVSVGNDRVAEVISQADAFRSPTGQFDRAAYGDLLRREGLTEAEFEHDVRMDEARLILQRAAVSGVRAPDSQARRVASWLLEKRDISWAELTADMLPAPVAAPDDATLASWHTANAERFTAPETRQITYIWLTPEMLADKVELDDAALKEMYNSKADEYQQPERRMVERLVFPDEAAAAAAKARIDKGEASFEKVVGERGLTLGDIDMGEVAKADLGPAGDAVFAAQQNGIVGPVKTDLGPALFSVNAILEPVSVTFEQALPDLRAEAAADRARRLIDEKAAGIEDLLAGGATLEQVAEETEMEPGKIDWTADAEAEPGQINGYQAFRERAAAVTDKDFPELFQLDDGGIFALRLDKIVPPALIPLDQVRDKVAADWTATETHRQLLALAEERKVEVLAKDLPAPAPENGAAPVATPAKEPATKLHVETGLTRDGFIEAAPAQLVADAFKLKPGETDIVDAENRVLLVRVDGVHPADLADGNGAEVVTNTAQRLNQSLQSDVFDYYARALQGKFGASIDQNAVAAIESRM